MVARFVNGKNIRGILHYNENKVIAGEANLLLASGFAGDVNQFSLEQKLQRFDHLTMLNSRTKTNAVHITLNFDGQDKLSNEQLQQITMSYMERIGFGDQPYLVYKHYDAAHAHVHIATINIKPDGSRIDTHGIGWKLSEPARIELEKEYGLVKAKGRQWSNTLGIKPADIEKALYGKMPTKRAITNIINAVIDSYKFTSLAEFNAVLKQFNVVANRGKEDTLMYQHKGLLYSIVNPKGEPIGVPIKASAIYNKPTLINLEKEYNKNIGKRKQYKEPLKETIEKVFRPYAVISKKTFIAELQKQNINAIFHINEQGFTYGVTYIDNKNKTVFNGSDLGKAYSAKAVMERLSVTDKLIKPTQQIELKPAIKTIRHQIASQPKTYLKPPEQTNYLALALTKYQPEAAPSVTRKKKRKQSREQSQDQGLTL
ncbi:relaxase/mobilization nuclease domain-containing protein [Mucilaginibacter sp. cycad4]|uniref:relaxase/mobilization nuclease domain-containing protein n=1 Tax=Mucilaginibacter sp. cycad4 TaxID=3342096 RepID=UPI002AAC00D9|nr:relaxase/mobilization nuclease domain-containing protein [Mucilaginibacter gossypii]WPU97872.1 relaxase/mobilization nuclease domain-containing protein [Mucilaginibacter gossypii]